MDSEIHKRILYQFIFLLSRIAIIKSELLSTEIQAQFVCLQQKNLIAKFLQRLVIHEYLTKTQICGFGINSIVSENGV